MKRAKVIVGSTFVVLAAACIGQMMLDAPPQKSPPRPEQTPSAQEAQSQAATQAETQPVSADEVVGTFLPSVKDGEEQSRLVALGGLMDVLDGPEYGKSPLGKENADALGEAIAPLVHESTGEPKETWQLKIRASRLLIGRTKSPAARELALKALDEGPSDLRDAAASELGRPEGVGGKAVFLKLQASGAGKIEPSIYVAALRRTGGKKAIEPILALMRSTGDPATVVSCVIALEDYRDPALMGPALERLEQTGLIEDSVKLPWISSALLNKHIETAEGSALTRGVKILRARPGLAKRGAAIFERAFEKGDEETRRIAAEAVKKAVMAKTFDESAAEKLLAEHPAAPAAPVLKAQLPGPENQPKQQ